VLLHDLPAFTEPGADRLAQHGFVDLLGKAREFPHVHNEDRDQAEGEDDSRGVAILRRRFRGRFGGLLEEQFVLSEQKNAAIVQNHRDADAGPIREASDNTRLPDAVR
jgi:hypothetical protein